MVVTHIRTCEGWLYLVIVLDMFLRQAISRSASTRVNRDWAINGLLMAIWRRQTKNRAMMHSDQDSHFSN